MSHINIQDFYDNPDLVDELRLSDDINRITAMLGHYPGPSQIIDIERNKFNMEAIIFIAITVIMYMLYVLSKIFVDKQDPRLYFEYFILFIILLCLFFLFFIFIFHNPRIYRDVIYAIIIFLFPLLFYIITNTLKHNFKKIVWTEYEQLIVTFILMLSGTFVNQFIP